MTTPAPIQPEILFERRGPLGLITLNRPAALNALTLHMIQQMDTKLANWAEEDSIKAVVITGAGERAFCAGGDVKAVVQEAMAARKGSGDGALGRAFFSEEYALNTRIHEFPKPYVSILNGIVMGGGMGISAHGSHRIATENCQFAMPETNIGFFPDVGGGYFLPRCPGQTGLYLALTSKKIGQVDAIYIGFATHAMTAEKIPALLSALQHADFGGRKDAHAVVSDILEDMACPVQGESELAPNRAAIDKCFGHDSIEDIVAALQAETTSFAKEALVRLHAVSPTSLKIALRQIRMGAGMDFRNVMSMEYAISQHCLHAHDFIEGVRAALIDKDKQPKWKPARIEDVSDDEIDAYFTAKGAGRAKAI